MGQWGNGANGRHRFVVHTILQRSTLFGLDGARMIWDHAQTHWPLLFGRGRNNGPYDVGVVWFRESAVAIPSAALTMMVCRAPGRRGCFRLLEGCRSGAGSNLSGPMTTAIRPDAKLPALLVVS